MLIHNQLLNAPGQLRPLLAWEIEGSAEIEQRSPAHLARNAMSIDQTIAKVLLATIGSACFGPPNKHTDTLDGRKGRCQYSKVLFGCYISVLRISSFYLIDYVELIISQTRKNDHFFQISGSNRQRSVSTEYQNKTISYVRILMSNITNSRRFAFGPNNGCSLFPFHPLFPFQIPWKDNQTQIAAETQCTWASFDLPPFDPARGREEARILSLGVSQRMHSPPGTSRFGISESRPPTKA